MSRKIHVRVTQEPGVVREVSEREFTDLNRQGLIYSHEKVAGRTSPRPWQGARGAEVVEAPAAMTDTKTGTDKEK